jgi:hypothetical protein
MPAFETIDRNDDAVIWAALATGNPSDFDESGERKVSAGAAIKVRWSFVNREAVDPKGNTIAIDVDLIVNQDVTIGSVFWLGLLSALPSPVTDVTNLYQCVTFEKLDDLRGRVSKRSCGLVRYSNDLPTIV